MFALRFLLLALPALIALLIGTARTGAAPVKLFFDASFEGLGTSIEQPLTTGVVEIGFLDDGVTLAQMVTLFQSGDFAGARASFNQVVTVTDLNSAGPGLPFMEFTLVADGDVAGLAVYKDPVSGPAGRQMFAWIRNAANEAAASEQAFVRSPLVFPRANDTLGFTDFSETFGTDSFALSANDVGIGMIANVSQGSGIDTNGGSPADGVGLNGGDKVLLARAFSTVATIAFSSATATIAENGGSVTLTVARSGMSDSMVTAQYSTANGSAQAGTDYTMTTGTVTFAAGDNSETIVVPVIDRPGFQGSRSFTVSLSNPGGGAQLGTPSSTTVEITDDEVSMAGQIVLSAATYSIMENAGSLVVNVRRTGGSDGAVSATFTTANGSATAGQDYTEIAGQVITFADGDASDKSVSISILNDSIFEGNETFTVALSAPQGGATLGSPNSATVTILEDDPVPTAGSFSFSSPNYTVPENGGNTVITVQRTGGSNGAVTVQFATSNGTATAGTDYTATSGTLTWADGDAADKTFSVPVIDNTVNAADKNFTVTLSNPTGGAVLAAPSTATVTITDDDPDVAGAFAFSAASYEVAENAGTATITVARTGGSDGAASVNYAATAGTATAGSDFTPANGTLDFAAGETQKTFTVAIIDDPTFEQNETVNLALSAPSGGATLGTPNTATLTILSDDGATIFTLDAATYSVTEGGTVTVRVLRSGGNQDQQQTVRYQTVDVTAKAGKDYLRRSAELTFAPGETEKTVELRALEDNRPENAESFKFKLSLSNPQDPSVTLGTPRRAIVTIARNEALDQPDLKVAASDFGEFVGDDVYNLTGNGQIAAQTVESGGSAEFVLKVENDGNITDTFFLKAANSGSANGATVRYSRGNLDVTEKITTGEGLRIARVVPDAEVEIVIEVRFRGGRSSTGYGATITATSKGTAEKQDVARVAAIIR